MAFFSTPLSELPPLDDDAAGHAANVLDSLQVLIRSKSGGFLPFDEYMHHVLYEPGLGYYSAGSAKFGAAGDFVTAPLMTPLFSQTLAKYIQNHMAEGDSVLELGAGNGRMAVDILLLLQAERALPEKYLILEASADLRQRQQQYIKTCLDESTFSRVQWLGTLPESTSFRGFIIGNEVIDAMPVKRFVLKGGQIYELGIAWEQDGLCLKIQEVDDDLSESISARLLVDVSKYPEDYISEINLLLPAWIEGLANCMQQGQILMLDYGYERSEFYQADRTQGTIRGYYRHYAVDDALQYPGLMDLTAWVDFTAVAEGAQNAGLDVAGYTTQANFLVDSGLLMLADSGLGEQTTTEYLSQVEQIKRLLEPGEMGESVKVIALTKSRDVENGFSRDMRYRL